MGNILEKKEDNTEEHKESLDNDEIPGDTQISNDHIEIIENKEEIEEKEQKEEKDNAAIGENGNQISQEVQRINEAIQRGEIQQYEIIQDEERGQVYQFVQNGKVYQMDQNGQLYEVIQEIQNGNEIQVDQVQNEQNYQMNQGQIYQYDNAQYYQPQLQMEQQGQPILQMGQYEQQYQPIQLSQLYQMNQENLLNQENQINNYIFQNRQIFRNNIQNRANFSADFQIVKVDNSSYGPNRQKNMEAKQSSKAEQVLGKNQKKSKINNLKSKNGNQKAKKRTEPKDSNPKVYLISNKKSDAEILNLNMTNYNRKSMINASVSNTKDDTRNDSSIQKLSLEVNKEENKFLTVEKNNTKKYNKILNNFDKTNLFKNGNEYIEIPRKDYKNYSLRDTITVGDGMDTGEYKFVGLKSLIKENEIPKINKASLNQEEISKEISSRNDKSSRKKKISYEIVDKFYALTELGGKQVKNLDKNGKKINKNDFYSALRRSEHNNNYSNFNKMDSHSANRKIDNYFTKNNSFQYKNKSNFKNNGNKTQYSFEVNEFKNEKPIRGEIKPYNSYHVRNFKKNIFELKKHTKKVIPFEPKDNYSKYLLEQINKIRTDPQSFIGVIEDGKANIKKDKYGRWIFNGKMKIGLAEGESAFNKTIEYLKNLNPMEPLEFDQNLVVPPPTNVHDIKDKDDIKRKVLNMMGNGTVIRSYWRDVVRDPEISFLLMIVDDNGIKSGMKRKDILNPTMKYIGITSAEINKQFVCYVTLS